MTEATDIRRPARRWTPILLAALAPAAITVPAGGDPPDATGWVPQLGSLTAAARAESELRNAVTRYGEDLQAVLGRFDAEGSPGRRAALRSFHEAWRHALDAMDFEALGEEGRVDWLLLGNRVASHLRRLEREEKLADETAALVPFAGAVFALHDALRDAGPVKPQDAAAALDELARTVDATRKALERALEPENGDDVGAPGLAPSPTPTVAHRAARRVESLRETLSGWFDFYDGYDPLFTWWAREPHQKADAALGDYVEFLRERIVGEKEGEDPPIVGDPIGREALLEDLALEMLPYTPEELLAIGEREHAWCEQEMIKASRELGFGDDWLAALEHVKSLHVEPGRQPELIRDLAREAIAFLEQRRLLTLPELARDVWRIEMIEPERQKLNPFFFFNDDAIWVSFPTETMTHEQKLMSMRGNNVHFSRATVHHELIPGHHLQLFMASRYNAHRQAFSTPFWIEGWALYWEMALWDLGFHATPEDRVGALFWRLHRAARIVFSLRFHLGEWTPQQAIDFLVERVGHERDNATAEVRRSFEGSYSPLYQLAYMIGALQFRALAAEAVGPEKMSARDFHDAVLRGGIMPVELVRARLLGQELGRAFRPSWRFAGEP